MGRPRKKLPPHVDGQDVYELLEIWGAEPVSKATAAKRFGLAPSTFRAVLNRNTRAADSWEAGRGEWETRLLKRLDDPSTRNIAGAIFALKSVFRYRELPEPPISENRVEIKLELPASLSEPAFERLMAEMRRKQLTGVREVKDVG